MYDRASIPNKEGFRLVAVMRYAARVPCVVRQNEAGQFRLVPEVDAPGFHFGLVAGWTYPKDPA